MVTLRTAHTADLPPATLRGARALLDDVFAGDFDDDDWDHSLGGIHALLWEDDALIGHAAVVARRLLHGGRALRAGYVEGVGVRPDRQRRGHGGTLMGALERVIRHAYDLGALGSSDEGEPLYAGRGWQRWLGAASVLTPAGPRRTPDEEGYIWVLPGVIPLDRSGELTCDWRDGDVW